MNILVTGGLGFIGCRLIKQLLVDFPKAFILIIDKESKINPRVFINQEHLSRINCIHDDLFTFNLSDLSEYPDYIIHLAASVNPDSYTDSDYSNFALTKRIADFSLANRCKLIFPSTTSIYGINHPSIIETMNSDSITPQTAYAADKYKTETYLEELALKGLRHCTLRFATIYGTSPNMKFITAIQKFCAEAHYRKSVTVWESSLKQTRPYLCIQDAVNSVSHVMKEDLFESSPYHLATLSTTVENILNQIARHTNFNIVFEDSHRMNTLTYAINCEKIQRSGFKFHGVLERSISEIFTLLAANHGGNKK